MAQVSGIRKVLAEQSHEGAIIYLAERVEALEKVVAELQHPVVTATTEPAVEEGN